jgi:hypothetical protein
MPLAGGGGEEAARPATAERGGGSRRRSQVSIVDPREEEQRAREAAAQAAAQAAEQAAAQRRPFVRPPEPALRAELLALAAALESGASREARVDAMGKLHALATLGADVQALFFREPVAKVRARRPPTVVLCARIEERGGKVRTVGKGLRASPPARRGAGALSAERGDRW